MYRSSDKQPQLIENFYLPFGGQLNGDNRWVRLAKLIPWDLMEERYSALFPSEKGNVAKPVRMALGALIIKVKGKYSDDDTVENIRENPYLQYFIGMYEYSNKAPFNPSSMTHFRKRLGLEIVMELLEKVPDLFSGPDEPDMIEEAIMPDTAEETTVPDDKNDAEEVVIPNAGTLIVDATCAPADIQYPTDLNLLNESREKLEEIIDTLYEPVKDTIAKPRTYREVARRDYLAVAKQRRIQGKLLRKGLKQQLNYISRNLKHIDKLLEAGSSLEVLSKRQLRDLWVVNELYRQQKEMFDKKECRIEDRIVSISQPHIRPIVRGKAKSKVEFGAKIAISLVDGYAFIDKLSWDNFNEGVMLKQSIELYKERFKCYPKVVIGDKIYRNKENIAYCKERGIRLSGPKPGRPSKDGDREEKKQVYQDSRERNAVEGKFGEGKRRYGLNLIMAKLKETGETMIALQFLVMNLEKRLRVLFFHVFQVLFPEFWEEQAV